MSKCLAKVERKNYHLTGKECHENQTKGVSSLLENEGNEEPKEEHSRNTNNKQSKTQALKTFVVADFC